MIQLQQRKICMDITKKFGFTLAEVLISLVILGIVAAITIPATISKSTNRANKIKIKKALSVYDNVINKIIIENNLPRSQSDLTNFINGNDNLCSRASTYFKIIELETPGNDCRFRASDGLWWDVTDISNTIVAFEKTDLNHVTANGAEYKAFKLVTRFDPQGSIRINDSGFSNYKYNVTNHIFKDPRTGNVDYQRFATDIPYKESIKKVQTFLNNEVYEEDLYAANAKMCAPGEKKSCTKAENWGSYYGGNVCSSYDKNGKGVVFRWDCESGCDKCRHWYETFTIPASDGGKYEWKPWECNEDLSLCANTDFDKYDKNGNRVFHAWFCNGGTDNPWTRCKDKYACVSCDNCEKLGYIRGEDGCYHLDPK